MSLLKVFFHKCYVALLWWQLLAPLNVNMFSQSPMAFELF